jgi:hypothetical protein
MIEGYLFFRTFISGLQSNVAECSSRWSPLSLHHKVEKEEEKKKNTSLRR